jgi:hypothetical protein
MPTQLETTKRNEPLSMEQAQSALSRAARNVGRIYGVGLSVGQQNDMLVFVDDLGEPVIDDFAPEGSKVIQCATQQELHDGTFLKLFAARSLYASLTLKVSEILESEA